MSEAQQKAKRRYLAKGKRLIVDFYPTEADLIEQVEKQSKKQTYIKDLIRKDMEAPGRWDFVEEPNTFDTLGRPVYHAQCSCCGFIWADLYAVRQCFRNCPGCGKKLDK